MPSNTLACDQSIGDGRDCDVSLSVNPFEALKPHFGMLLGVHDFQTIDAYHRGKQWLHSAWLHRSGVVWGMEVSIDTERDEIRVEPGLAVDALGRELYLPKPVCLNIPTWLKKHRDDEAFQGIFSQPGDVDVTFSVHVVIQFRACLARQVPALMEPCEGGSSTTAYSRIMESVEVLLKPGLAPVIGSPGRIRPYHRLRLLFNLEPPNTDEGGAVVAADQEVIDERGRIVSLNLDEQPREYLQVFREFAALDEMELKPTVGEKGDYVSIFPEADPAPLILADLENLVVRREDFRSGTVNNKVRDVHIATATIQELLCGPLFQLNGSIENPGGDFAPRADAGGPRIEPSSVDTEGASLMFTHTGEDLLRRSVEANVSVFVSSYDVNTGWIVESIADITFDNSQVGIVLDRDGALASDLIRLVVKGTGPTPVLGSNRVPLAGRAGGPPGTVHEGHDFVFLLNREN